MHEIVICTHRYVRLLFPHSLKVSLRSTESDKQYSKRHQSDDSCNTFRDKALSLARYFKEEGVM